MDNIPKVKLVSDGTLHRTNILVGDKQLRATRIVFEIDNKNNERGKLTVETYVDLVNVEVLQKDTELVIKDLLHV